MCVLVKSALVVPSLRVASPDLCVFTSMLPAEALGSSQDEFLSSSQLEDAILSRERRIAKLGKLKKREMDRLEVRSFVRSFARSVVRLHLPFDSLHRWRSVCVYVCVTGSCAW